MTTSVTPAAALSSPGTGRVAPGKRAARGANRIGRYIIVRLLPVIPMVFPVVMMVLILMKTIGGLLTVLGQELPGVRERRFRPGRSDIGFVSQDPATGFNPLGTIEECVAEPPIVDGRAPDARSARGRVDEPLEAVQLPRALGVPKHPYTKRLLTSLPVPKPAEQAMRRGELRLLRVEYRP
jgi:ABC-type dipeptide/oligopeptide/nickel transport system ATPase component